MNSHEQLLNHIFVLVLQHPQEPAVAIGTVPVIAATLKNASVKVGLSWPNLNKAVGHETQAADWAVLYLGSGPKSGEINGPVSFLDRKGGVLPEVEEKPKGLIILDGTWSQAKTLWWRNPWLLKVRRMVLHPDRPARYHTLRKEPRRECLSSVESLMLALTHLGEDSNVTDELNRRFEVFMADAKQPARS